MGTGSRPTGLDAGFFFLEGGNFRLGLGRLGLTGPGRLGLAAGGAGRTLLGGPRQAGLFLLSLQE